MENMTIDKLGHVMDEPYQCIHCHPIRTQPSQNQTMMNVEKYMVIQLKIFNFDQVSEDFNKTVPNFAIEDKINNMVLGTFRLQAIVYHIGCSPFQGHYKSSVKYDNIWYTTNDLNYSIGVKMGFSTNDTGMIPYLLIYGKIVNDPLLISNVETDMSRLTNELHNTGDVLEKVDECYETERIADELVLHEEIYSENSDLNLEYNASDLEKGNIDFVVTESYKKDDIRCNPVLPSSSEIRSLDAEEMSKESVLCELGRQKEKKPNYQ